MPFTMFTLAMLLICILCIGKEVFRGFVRGPLRALVSLCAIVLGMICSLFVSRMLGGLLSNVIMEEVVNEFLENNTETLVHMSSACNAIAFLIQVVVNILIFAIIFPIFRWIIDAIISLIIKLGLKKTGVVVRAENKQDKLLGAIVGFVCGIVLTAAASAPIVGTLHVLGDAVSLVESLDENILPREVDDLEEYTSDVVGNLCYSMGGELVFKHLTVADFGEGQVSAIDEIKSVQRAVESVSEIAQGFSQHANSLDFSASADMLCESLEESEILKALTVEFTSECCSAWLLEEPFMGVYRPDFNEEFIPIVNEILLILSDINEYNVTPTARLLLDFIGVLIECDINVNTKTEEIDGMLLVTKLNEVFEEHSNTVNIKWTLENIAVEAIADFAANNLTDTQRASIATTIAGEVAQVLNDVSGTHMRIQAVREKLVVRFEEYGLSIDPSLCELFAYRLVTMAEANHDQISSFDVEALLGQNREE